MAVSARTDSGRLSGVARFVKNGNRLHCKNLKPKNDIWRQSNKI